MMARWRWTFTNATALAHDGSTLDSSLHFSVTLTSKDKAELHGCNVCLVVEDLRKAGLCRS